MTSTIRRSLRVTVVLGALGLAFALPAAPASAASPAGCRIENRESGIVRRTLQKAVNVADAGDHLLVQGQCHGTTTIGIDLHLNGLGSIKFGVPTLDGDDAGSVLIVSPGATLSIRRLSIVDGSATSGGGIYNQGALSLFDVRVKRNAATTTAGGGVYNNGALKLGGATRISRNHAGGPGGGVYNNGAFTMNASSSVRGNQADGPGGGVYNNGAFTMNASSSVRGNQASAGGGVFDNGAFSGGICAPAPGANVFDNTPNDCGGI